MVGNERAPLGAAGACAGSGGEGGQRVVLASLAARLLEQEQGVPRCGADAGPWGWGSGPVLGAGPAGSAGAAGEACARLGM